MHAQVQDSGQTKVALQSILNETAARLQRAKSADLMVMTSPLSTVQGVPWLPLRNNIFTGMKHIPLPQLQAVSTGTTKLLVDQESHLAAVSGILHMSCLLLQICTGLQRRFEWPISSHAVQYTHTESNAMLYACKVLTLDSTNALPQSQVMHGACSRAQLGKSADCR